MQHIGNFATDDQISYPVKPGNGCWIWKQDTGINERGCKTTLDSFDLFHVAPTPAPKPLTERQRAKAQRRATFKRHCAWIRETRLPKDWTQQHMAEAYARWLLERDNVAVPHGADMVQLDWDSADIPGASWAQCKRIKTVVFGRMVANEPPAHLNASERRKWRNRNPSRVFQALLAVEIPHWDHVPQMTEETVQDQPRPFAPLPTMADQIAA